MVIDPRREEKRPQRPGSRHSPAGLSNTALRELLEPFAVVNLEQALQAVVARCAELMGATRASIFLRNPRQAAFTLAAAHGVSPAARKELAGRPLTLAKLPSWVRDMQHHGRGVHMASRRRASSPTETKREPDTALPWHARPVLGVPLTAGGETVALLFLESCSNATPAEQRRLGDLLAATLGPALAAAWRRDGEQAELWEECHRLEHLLALNARATSHLDIAEVLSAVAREAMAAVGAHSASLALIQGPELVVATRYPESEAPLEPLRLGDGPEGEAAATGVPQRRHGPDLSTLSVPIDAAGIRLGVLNVYGNGDASGFSDADQRLLQGLAGQVALALQGARRRGSGKRGEKELDLRNIGLTLGSSLEVDETLQTVAEMTVEMLHARICLVLSFRDDTHLLRVCAASTGTGIPVQAAVGLDEESLAARAIQSGLPTWVEDGVEPPRLAPRNLSEYFAVRAGIAVPIRDGARVTGVILAYHLQPRRYSADEVQLLVALAAQANAALHNSALYEHQRAIAETVQRSLLPRLPATISGLEFGHAYLPRSDRVGGDYYDLAPFPDGRCGIVVGDVSGSGLAAAIHTAMGKYMLRAYAIDHEEPGTVLRKINDAICAYSNSEVFLTLFYGVLYPGGRLRYANAAHPYPILRRANGTGPVLLETTGTVVGIIPEQTYQDREIHVEPGDILLLYTDGITEAMREGEMFGTERLKAAVRHWEGTHPQHLVDHVVRSVRGFLGGQPHDDIAVLAIRVR